MTGHKWHGDHGRDFFQDPRVARKSTNHVVNELHLRNLDMIGHVLPSHMMVVPAFRHAASTYTGNPWPHHKWAQKALVRDRGLHNWGSSREGFTQIRPMLIPLHREPAESRRSPWWTEDSESTESPRMCVHVGGKREGGREEDGRGVEWEKRRGGRRGWGRGEGRRVVVEEEEMGWRRGWWEKDGGGEGG